MQSVKILIETGEFNKEIDAVGKKLLNSTKIYQLKSLKELIILKCSSGRKKMNQPHSKMAFNFSELLKSIKESKGRVVKSSDLKKNVTSQSPFL